MGSWGRSNLLVRMLLARLESNLQEKKKKENLFKKRKTFGPLIYSIELHSGGLELRATELQLLDYHDWFDSSGWNFSKIASDLLLQLIGIAISWHGYRSCSATLLPLCSQKYKWVWMNGQGNLIKWQGGGGGGGGVVNEQLFHLHMIVCNIFFFLYLFFL